MVDAVSLDFAKHLTGVCHRLGHVGEYLIHLLTGLEPLLLGIEHAVGVVEVTSCGEADKVVVRLGVLLIHEMHVVRTHQLNIVLACQRYQTLVDFLLKRKCLAVGALVGVFHLMTLQLKVEIVAEQVFKPKRSLFSLFHIAVPDGVGDFSGNTC